MNTLFYQKVWWSISKDFDTTRSVPITFQKKIHDSPHQKQNNSKADDHLSIHCWYTSQVLRKREKVKMPVYFPCLLDTAVLTHPVQGTCAGKHVESPNISMTDTTPPNTDKSGKCDVSSEIGDFYRSRWQIELLWKFLKRCALVGSPDVKSATRQNSSSTLCIRQSGLVG